MQTIVKSFKPTQVDGKLISNDNMKGGLWQKDRIIFHFY